MSKAKIQKGDTIKVVAGNYKGTTGQVLKIVKTGNGKYQKTRASISTVPGITKYRRSFKFSGQSYPGMMYTVPRLIDVSNLSHTTEDGKLTKVKIQTEDGKKVRVQKKTGKVIESVRVVETPKELENPAELTNN